MSSNFDDGVKINARNQRHLEIISQEIRKIKVSSKVFKISVLSDLQGLPTGFDIMYLVLRDRNIQFRFGMKVIRES